MDLDMPTIQARSLFPRGLMQPKHYRFAVDALLLAAFATPKPGSRGLDLGTGCGVIGLAVLLAQADRGITITGLDADSDMVAAARVNATELGLSDVFDVVEGEVSSYELHAESYDFVLCNPPFREPGHGRGASGAARQRARFATDETLAGFWAAARRALRRDGALWLVFLPERLTDLFAGLRGHGMEPKRLRLVHGRTQSPARLALVEARKGGGPGLTVEPPLLLYGSEESASILTEAALAFCPFLQCNARATQADRSPRQKASL